MNRKCAKCNAVTNAQLRDGGQQIYLCMKCMSAWWAYKAEAAKGLLVKFLKDE